MFLKIFVIIYKGMKYKINEWKGEIVCIFRDWKNNVWWFLKRVVKR